MNMKYQYTIIIPHFNIPRLLRRCLWSIPKRDDTQVIVVDDRSSDENIAELKKLEADYTYVTFIYSSENGGGGRARNIGLMHALGEYVLFADADDFFNYCLDDILDKYQEEICDVVFFNARYVDTDTYLDTNRCPAINILMRKYKKTHNTEELKYLFGEPWCKLIRRNFLEVNNIRFDSTPIHNDTTFSYMVGFHSKSVKVDNIGLYCLADRTNSVSKVISESNLLTRVKVFSKKNRFLRENNIPFFDYQMITSFEIFILRGDYENLKKCFDIASEYGFSKPSVCLKLIKYELGRVIHKMFTIVTIRLWY